MPRVYTTKAAKDYPNHGVKKGDLYYHWSFFRGPKKMSKTPPRQSQLTNSETLSNAYAASEALADAIDDATCPQDVIDALQEVVDDDAGVIDGFDEKINNLEEAFTGGCPAIDETTEQRDNYQSFMDECEGLVTEIEGLEASEYADEEDDKGKKIESYEDLSDEGKAAMLSAAKEIGYGASFSG
jgi:hypothetical protein